MSFPAWQCTAWHGPVWRGTAGLGTAREGVHTPSFAYPLGFAQHILRPRRTGGVYRRPKGGTPGEVEKSQTNNESNNEGESYPEGHVPPMEWIEKPDAPGQPEIAQLIGLCA